MSSNFAVSNDTLEIHGATWRWWCLSRLVLWYIRQTALCVWAPISPGCLLTSQTPQTRPVLHVFHWVPEVFLKEKDETTTSVVQAGYSYTSKILDSFFDDSARSVPNLFHAQVHHIYFLSCRWICKKGYDSRLGPYPDCICFILFVYIFSIEVLPSIYHSCAGQGWAAEHAKVVGPRGGRAVVTRRFALRRRKSILCCWRLKHGWWV